MVFQCIKIHQVPWEVLKPAAFCLGFQHLPYDLTNVNAWKNMFDPNYKMDLLMPSNKEWKRPNILAASSENLSYGICLQ